MPELTERQQAIYDFIKEYIRERSIAPSYEEIRRAFRFRSYNSVQKHLKRLEEKVGRDLLIREGRSLRRFQAGGRQDRAPCPEVLCPSRQA